MNELDFEVFIGTHNKNVPPTIVAKVYPNFVIPHGEVDESGDLIQASNICFKRIEALALYFADWIDIIGDEKLIKAKIHLNTNSLFKTFQGNQILEFVDKLNSMENFSQLRSLDIL